MVYKFLKRLAANQHTKALLIIFLILFAVYAIAPIMHHSQNPIAQRSGLTSEQAPAVVSGQSTIDPNDGFTSQALGHRAADSWLSGDVPYWNHYEGVGAPLAGGMQAAALFPLTLLLHFSSGFMYFHFLLQLLAGFATNLFFRKLKLRFSVAVLGGVLFSLNGAFAWLTNAPFNPIAFLPLLMLSIEHAVSYAEKKKQGGWMPLALTLSLSLYAGFPETVFIYAIFAYGWGLIRLLSLDKTTRKALVYKVFLGSVVALLLAAPALVAFVGYLPYAFTGGHGSSGYAYVGLPLATVPALFMPYIFGPIFGFVNTGQPQDLFLFWSNVGGYLTVPLLLVAVFGLYSKQPRALKWYLALFSLVVMLKIYSFKPIAFLINLIPGMDQVAFYRYSVPALSFAIIMLAMFGVEALLKREINKKKIIILTALVAALTIMLALSARPLFHQLIAFPDHRWWAILSVCWALSILVIIPLAFLKSRWKFVGIAALLTADAFVMFALPMLSLPKKSPVDTAPVTYLQANLGLNRFYTLHPIAPNYGSYYKIASINTNDLPIPKKWNEYVPKRLDSNSIPLIFTGYSRAAATGPTALEEFGRNIQNYEATGVKYLVVDHTQVTEQFSQQHSLKLAYSDALIDIYELPQPKPYFQAPANCKLTPQDYDNLTANCQQPATLNRLELYLPGWSAKVNGTKQTVQSGPEIFQKVSVPSGKSKVQFTYNPPFIGLAYAAMIVGLLAVLIPVIRSGTRKIRR